MRSSISILLEEVGSVDVVLLELWGPPPASFETFFEGALRGPLAFEGALRGPLAFEGALSDPLAFEGAWGAPLPNIGGITIAAGLMDCTVWVLVEFNAKEPLSEPKLEPEFLNNELAVCIISVMVW